MEDEEEEKKLEIQPAIEDKQGNEFDFLNLFDGGSSQQQPVQEIATSSLQPNQGNGWGESSNQGQNNDGGLQINFNGFMNQSLNQNQLQNKSRRMIL